MPLPSMKRLIEAVDCVKNKRPKSSNHLDEARFLYPSEIAFRLNNAKGSHIDKLRSEHDAMIHVTKCSGPHGYLTIVATNYNIVQVMSTLLGHFDYNYSSCTETADYGRHKNNLDTTANNVDIRMLVHENVLESIAKDDGLKIQGVAEKNDAKIVFYSVNCPLSTDRVVQIVGSPSACLNCIEELLVLIRCKPKKDLCIKRYDPINHTFYTRNRPDTALDRGTRKANVVYQPVFKNTTRQHIAMKMFRRKSAADCIQMIKKK